MRMSKPENKGLVPALRFPEFRDEGGWNKKSLAPYIEQYSERASSNTELEVYSSTRDGLKPQSEYFDGRNLVNDGEYGVVPTGYFVYRHMSDDDVFKFNLNQLDKKIAVSKEYPVFKAVNLDASFLLFKLNEGQEFKRFAASQKKGGTRTRLYFNTLRTFESFLPAFEEQQKIADCLTSIDELINALKSHKKGLVQKLFPAEGETVPKLRFPEFRDKGEWVEKTLDQVAEYENGKAHEQDIDDQGRYIVVNSKFISTEGEVRKFSNVANFLAKKDDILMVLSDVPNGRAIAKCFYVNKDSVYTVNQRICKLTSKKNTVSTMLFYILDRNAYFLAFDDGVKQTNLKKEDVLNCPVLLPADKVEQQRIADCLSSIDELISAQTQKLEALKTHKKGLMQQLFPAMAEDCIDAKGEVSA